MPPSKKASAKSTLTDPDLELIASLAEILNDTGLSEIELDRKGTKFRVAKQVTAVASIASAPPAPVVHAHAAPVHEAPAAPAKASGDHPGTVKSPMVGTVYMAPSPGAANFIEIGSTVKEGQTLLIIEAMKTMNQIHAPRSGKVTAIYVENGHPVEYGEPLVAIE
ncbi:acetyl-CoA carboxylase biotin carboxyl carrier protein [Aestuariivirga litoralis]|uniref:Biotin carboxyl carrier protein of acetyl-CoA carboxylase n=1 Tax=Aestuariivirga litoralis TaxID=2650924 RepID=A0A2W2ALF7_9HYPH|nr:acetyl-CoA carboxylase biotin carboxyl carrier protein [Aestuariivirga litoralis]PZF76211.1 acetyl-CoA carboxylase biotin carboxyl carrier protein [Aestuariivirga litoralis]